MAEAFLRQLPRIPSYTLPKDALCPICVQPYENQTTDSGSFERAICLPCNHIFGSECLSKWLSHGKTCPLCRYKLVFPIEDDIERERDDAERLFLTFNIQRNRDWYEYWYATFWILHIQGDKALEERWQQWQQDWIAAAEQWDLGAVRARAALSSSRLTSQKILDDERQFRVTAAAIQTLRFREYRLYLQLQPDEAERPELKAPPVSQLTPTQEDALFRELERRDAFRVIRRFTTISTREQWNKLREFGFVWDPDCGRWSRYSY